MARALDLSILGALTLVGAGAGLQLGWSAIAEINPIHFADSRPASSFHSDLVPNGGSDSGPQMPQAEQASVLELGSGCIGCRTYPVDHRPVQDPAIEQAYQPSQVEEASPPVQLASHEEEAPEETARRVADLQRVELYSRAPVTVEEVRVETPAPEEAQPVTD